MNESKYLVRYSATVFENAATSGGWTAAKWVSEAKKIHAGLYHDAKKCGTCG